MSSDNLDKYLPEFDANEILGKLEGRTREELIDMLIYAYKEKRVWAKMLGEVTEKLGRIEKIATEHSSLLGMPAIPTAEELRRMMEDDLD